MTIKKTISILVIIMLAGFGIYKISTENKSGQITSIKSEPAKAEEALVSFFMHLNNQDFEKALVLFELNGSTSSWEWLENFSLPEDRNDKAKVLQRYCEATGTCLQAEVIEIKKEAADSYNLLVQFQKTDGNTFVLGPCCGASEEEMPPQDKFEFKVKKIDGEFKVITAPIYVP